MSVINGEALSSTLVKGSSLPWLKTPQSLKKQHKIKWNLKVKSYKIEKASKN